MATRAPGLPLPVTGETERPKKPVGGALEEAGEIAVFAFRALRALPGTLRYFSEVVRINAIITRRTSLLLLVMCGFLGFSAGNFGFFLLRSLGASDFVGIFPGILTPRLLAPEMFGYVFAGAVCCAITAELGAARINEEIDAYECDGIDPMELLVGTRILGSLLFVPLAAAIAVFGVFAGTYLNVVVVLQGNTSAQFVNTFFDTLIAGNIVYCAITLLLLTIQCSVIACFYGMRESGRGADAVGGAVARSLGVNMVFLHIVLAIAGLAFYGGSDLSLPIGD